DARLAPLLVRSGELGMPISIHVADPIWMYQPMDETNDGLMNAVKWRLDDKPGIVDHAGMVAVPERAVARHPRTTFVACHLVNLDYDLDQLGALFDRLPNLYADFAARFAETAVIPRTSARFFARYRDRLVYGTDMGATADMYRLTFRMLATRAAHASRRDEGRPRRGRADGERAGRQGRELRQARAPGRAGCHARRADRRLPRVLPDGLLVPAAPA